MLLVIDNYDSFHLQLVQVLFGELGAEVLVFETMEVTLEEIEEMKS